eukprot:snap_masked-scaffold_10-processed-gene-11.38-mRNA-1 protein AED:1.00 eAED:1.00 QI:0/0/0/0/1/1/2/0/65
MLSSKLSISLKVKDLKDFRVETDRIVSKSKVRADVGTLREFAMYKDLKDEQLFEAMLRNFRENTH